MAIKNTSDLMRDPEEAAAFLGAAMMLGSNRTIERAEEQGQRDLVESQQLPSDMQGDREAFERMGIKFGPPDPKDPLFLSATLPPGWRVIPTNHSMWSTLLDDKGRERASIFYKAAFYDRSSHMHPHPRFTIDRDRSSADWVRKVYVKDAMTGTTVFEAMRDLSGERDKDKDAFNKAGWDADDTVRAEAEAWLKERYPEWKNRAAYWDDPQNAWEVLAQDSTTEL